MSKQNKPKLAFIGRVTHQKTKSDQFFIDLLKPHFDIHFYLRETLKPPELVAQLNDHQPDITIFYQLPPSFSKHLLKIKTGKFVWVPMWDGFKQLPLIKKWGFRMCGLKVINFCKIMHNYLETTGLKALNVQYFPPLHPRSQHLAAAPPYTVFLWQRDPKIGLSCITKLFPANSIKKVIYKSDHSLGNSQDVFPFEVERLNHWLTPEEYKERLQQADFYIAPRFSEGIGFSFLEAMAMDRIVLGYNEATMNEYIKDGKTGYLFDDEFRLSHEIKAPVHLVDPLRTDIEIGHTKWKEQEKDIIRFLLDP